MYSFVILGQIPGTDITISFTMWVELALFVGTLIAWITVRQNHTSDAPAPTISTAQ
jgi:hypothetical protein